MDGYFKWSYVIDYFPKLLTALPVTLSIVAAAMVSGVLLGAVVAFIRLEQIPVLSRICKIWVSFIRGTPILIQMFVVYYGLIAAFAALGINISRLDRIYFLYTTFGLNTAGFLSEVFRAAIQSVPKTQKDAAFSVGHTKMQAYIRIIIPQSIIIAIPSIGTTMSGLLQDSSLAFLFGIIDVIGKVSALSSRNMHTLEGYFDTAIIFVLLTIALEKLFAWIEIRTRYQQVIA